MKFNMGSGQNPMAGYVNVDSSAVAGPDQVFDLEQTPWPWSDNCAEEVIFNHSLEHMGATAAGFFAIIRELYRICAPGAVVRITVPHPRHDNFIGDPTHVRIVTPQVMSLFDRASNDQWKAAGASNSPLGHYLDVDFVLESVVTVLDEPHISQFQSGAITQAEVIHRLRSQNNVATEFKMVLRARKGAV